jgi:hypothetical protein
MNTIITEDEIRQMRKELRNKKLKRYQIDDIIFTKVLDRLSVEQRYRLMFFCALNDTMRYIM